MLTFKRIVIYALPVAALGLVYLALQPVSTPEPVAPVSPPRGGGLPLVAEARQRAGGVALSAEETRLIAALRQQFGADLANPRSQLRLLDKLLSYLRQKYPEDWQDRIYALLRALDPTLADRLYQRLQQQLDYSAWQGREQRRLAQLDNRARRQELWAKRRELFGADADIIWEPVLKDDQIAQSLEAIVDQPALPLPQKRQQYVEAIRQAWGAEATGFVAEHRQELIERFLDVDVVQDDLHALAPAARQQELTALRQALGMDEAALARWRELDARRDQRWAQGRDYEAARATLSERYQGEALQQQLNTLQQRLFGAEAEAIRSEEQAGYYRFRQRQQYGVN